MVEKPTHSQRARMSGAPGPKWENWPTTNALGCGWSELIPRRELRLLSCRVELEQFDGRGMARSGREASVACD
jgi:hypothetical protein